MTEPTKPEPERRVAKRKMFKNTAHILVSGKPPISVRTVDISTTGISIVAAINPPAKFSCNIRFIIPSTAQGGLTIEAGVSVVYSIFSSDLNGFKIGCNFVSTDGFLKALEQFVNS